LPPTATPYGYSLTDMTRALAAFSFNHNDPALLPKTPFQILYKAPGTNTNSFAVKPGTTFFVPILNADDPGLPDFPTTNAAAQTYLSSSKFLGGQFTIKVDDVVTSVPATYVGGPVTVAPLPDGGTKVFTIGVFLHPLAPGQHTVTIAGLLNGDLVGTPAYSFSVTYTVSVVPGHA
jgi:hypothetical protein